jgi:hypothetical protein
MDETQIRKANPSYPKRTPRESIDRMRKNLKNNDSWKREALGVWDKDGFKSWQVFPKDVWQAGKIAAEAAPQEGVQAWGVKFSIDYQWVSLGVAIRSDGITHVETFGAASTAHAIAPLVRFLAKEERWRAGKIQIDGASGVDDFAEALREAGVPGHRIVITNVSQARAAHAGFLRALNERTLTHLDPPDLHEPARITVYRKISQGGGFGWASGIEDGDVTALDAVTLAHYRAVNSRRPGSRGRRPHAARNKTNQ